MTTKTKADKSEEQHASVFISYAREDIDFVRLLDAALEKHNRESWVDLEDIRPTEEWLASVLSGIESANAFVFVISPDSVESKSCLQELAHAVEHNKRLIPIVQRDVDASAVPEPLRSPQWIFFREGDDFEEAFQKLVDALDTDLDWVHAHTRLLTRAIEWDQNGRDTNFVLRGNDLKAAEEWQVRAADRQPKLTVLQNEYVFAGRKAATRRQRITLGAVTIGLVVAVFLGVFAWSQRNEAIEQSTRAQRQARIALGRQLVAQAQLSAEQKPQPLQRSVLLALEARKQSPLPSFEADQILRDALTILPRSVARLSHEGDVTEVAFSSDGELLATASEDWTARVWETASGEEVAHVTHEGPVASVALSPNGKFMATGMGHTVRIWETMSGQHIGRIPLTDTTAYHVDLAFTPDGDYLITAPFDGPVRMWDWSSGDQVVRMKNGESTAFSKNGKYMATSVDNTARVWETISGEEVARVEQEHDIAALDLSADGRHLATVENSRNGTASSARVWEINSGEEVTHVTQKAPAGTTMVGITGVALSRGGGYLATVSPDRSVRIWNMASGKVVARITHEDKIRHLILDGAFSPDGEYLVTAGADDTARMWDFKSTREFVTITRDGDVVEDVASRPRSRHFATSSTDVRLWDPTDGEEVARMDGFGDVVFSPDGEQLAARNSETTVGVWGIPSGKEVMRVPQEGSVFAFSPDGDYLATDSNGTVRVWNLKSGEEVTHMTHKLSDSLQDLADLAFNPNGKYLATAGNDLVLIWDLSSREVVARIRHDNDPYEPGRIVDIAFSPDGKYLATASDDRTVRLWVPNSGEEIARMNHSDGVMMLVFSPNGKYLATATGRLPMIGESGESFTAHIWNPSSGEEVARMAHDNLIHMITFSPDGEFLATASDDKTARVWDVFSGTEVARMTHDDGVQDVAFSSDGSYLATASAGTTRVWLWRRPETLSVEACKRLTRNLTKEEWQQYLDDKPYRKTCPNVPNPEE